MENDDFTALRKMGDDRHNSACIEKGEGEIIIARRPTEKQFDVSNYGPCILCRQWLCLKGIKYHFEACKKLHNMTEKIPKKHLVMQAKILAGHIIFI